jgi:hypothetical protein
MWEQHFQAFLKHVPHGAIFGVQACNFALSLDMQALFSLGESVDALSFTQSRKKKKQFFYDLLLYVKNRIMDYGLRGLLR